MNKKERLIAAVNLKSVDRIPCTFRANDLTARKLMSFFKIKNADDFAKSYKQLLQKLGADFWSTGTKIDKFAIFLPEFKGKEPEEPYVDDGNYFYTIGIKAKKAKMKNYEISYPHIGVEPPLGGIQSAEELNPGFLMSHLSCFDFSHMKNRYGDINIDEDNLICIGSLNSLFMICCYLRGMEKFMMDLAFNKKLAELIIKEVGDFCIEFSKREVAAAKNQAVYYGSWDDIASQEGIMFDPAVFRKYFLPVYKTMISNCKKQGLLFGWHVCGSVHQFLPAMIDAGIDVFDVVQTSAKNMDIENLFQLYGRSVCFHGGLDIQKLLVEATAQKVREEVRRIKDLWGNRGGMILAPTHLTLPDTPIQNLISMYEEINH